MSVCNLHNWNILFTKDILETVPAILKTTHHAFVEKSTLTIMCWNFNALVFEIQKQKC